METFPQNGEEAHARQLLKIHHKSELKHNRAVYNLTFIFEVLEKVVCNRLQAHIKNNHSI